MSSSYDELDAIELEEKAVQLAEQIADLVQEIFDIDLTEGEHDSGIYLQEFIRSLLREIQDEYFDSDIIRE